MKQMGRKVEKDGKKTFVNVRFDDEDIKKLNILCAEYDVSRAELIRYLIKKEYVNR